MLPEGHRAGDGPIGAERKPSHGVGCHAPTPGGSVMHGMNVILNPVFIVMFGGTLMVLLVWYLLRVAGEI